MNPFDRKLDGLQRQSGRYEVKFLDHTGTRTPTTVPSSPSPVAVSTEQQSLIIMIVVITVITILTLSLYFISNLDDNTMKVPVFRLVMILINSDHVS
jgi:hypothetical protein